MIRQARGTGQVFYGTGASYWPPVPRWPLGRFQGCQGVALYAYDPAFSYGDYAFRGLVPCYDVLPLP